MNIKVNMIRCKLCNEVIESRSTHDIKWCSCGAVGVDGGKDYLGRMGNEEDMQELSKYEDE